MWNGSFQEVEVEWKISQISSQGTTRSTIFKRTKRGTERLVPLRSVPSHVPNGSVPNKDQFFCLSRLSRLRLLEPFHVHDHPTFHWTIFI